MYCVTRGAQLSYEIDIEGIWDEIDTEGIWDKIDRRVKYDFLHTNGVLIHILVSTQHVI